MELEHVGIAVRDAEAAASLLEALLGERPYKSQTVEAEGVRTYFLRAGGAKLELLEALHEESPITRYLEKRGPGLHHLAFEVDDLDAVYDRLSQGGFTVLGEPRSGADGKRIFFVHPRDAGGILIEFCRQERSMLTDPVRSAAGPHTGVRRTASHGPALFIHDEISLDIETLARRLEQSTHVIVAGNISAAVHDLPNGNDFHVVMPSHRLSNIQELGTSVRTVTIVVEEPCDAAPTDRPTLIAARPSAASAAAALYERWGDADLIVGSDDILAIAIEKHVRQTPGP